MAAVVVALQAVAFVLLALGFFFVSLFFYNYYGKQRLVDVGGLATELNLEERIPLEEEQVWSFDREETKLTRKSGGTDAGFICTAIRDFDSAASQI